MDSILAPVTIQQIIVFMRVAEFGGFAKASHHLNMTQSAVSKSIAKLEKQLGILLFQRTTREIHLTEAGQLLFTEWKDHVAALHDSYIRAASIQNQADQTLSAGILNTARPELYFWDIEEHFEKTYPEVRLDIATSYMTEMIGGVKNGTYDLVMVPDFMRSVVDEEGMCWKWAARSTAFVLMHSDHPLSKHASLTMEEIVNENFATLEMGDVNPHLDDLAERMKRYGTEPRIVFKYRNAYEIRFLFQKRKDALLMTDAYFDYPQSPEIARVPVTDQRNGIICVWNPNNEKPALQKFLNLLKPAAESTN